MSTTIFIVGLPGSGKTTLATAVRNLLPVSGPISTIDSDVLRKSLNSDLGFSSADRFENQRRFAHVCGILNASGVHVIASIVAPKEDSRCLMREIIKGYAAKSYLVFLNCDVETCSRRRINGGFYLPSDYNLLEANLTCAYEAPLDPDLVLDTANNSRTVNSLKLASFLASRMS
jgi:adenylylsulfate kinase